MTDSIILIERAGAVWTVPRQRSAGRWLMEGMLLRAES
jgi:hypothetical protein